MSDRSAASLVGLSRATVSRWLNGERPFDEVMRSRIMQARATREQRWLGVVEQASKVPLNNGSIDWRAATWLLERTNPEYAAVQKHEVGGPGGAPLRVEHDVEHSLAQPDKERLAIVAQLLTNAGAMPQLEAKGTNGNGHSETDK